MRNQPECLSVMGRASMQRGGLELDDGAQAESGWNTLEEVARDRGW